MTGRVGRRDGVWIAYPDDIMVPGVTPYASELKALRNAARDNLRVVFVNYGDSLPHAVNTPPAPEPEPEPPAAA